MEIQDLTFYQNNDIIFRTYHVPDGTTRYWLQAGVIGLELDEGQLCDLYLLLDAYFEAARDDDSWYANAADASHSFGKDDDDDRR